jgi:hypothetical protein
VNQAVLPHLNPAHVEVELWRADALEVRRGLSSELDEMWSYVQSKANLAKTSFPPVRKYPTVFPPEVPCNEPRRDACQASHNLLCI